MPADHAAFVPVPERRAGDVGQCRRSRVVGLVHVEIDLKIVPHGECEEPIQQRIDVVEGGAMIADRRSRHATEQTLRLCHHGGDPVAKFILQ